MFLNIELSLHSTNSVFEKILTGLGIGFGLLLLNNVSLLC